MSRRDDMERGRVAAEPDPASAGRSSWSEGAEYSALVGRTVAEVERELILETLKRCHGNRTHAANILGISIRTLRNKLHEYADDGVMIPPAGTGAGDLGYAG